jgi:hypothetical protein
MISYSSTLKALRLVLLAASIGGCAPALAAQGTSGCRPNDTDRTKSTINYLRNLVSSSDTNRVRMRSVLGVQSAQANKVTLVTKTVTCQTAVTALNGVRSEPNAARQVFVYTWGLGFAVEDPALDVPGMDHDLYIFDKNWVSKSIVNGL